MKKIINTIIIVAATTITFTACKKKEVETPDVEEQELITTFRLHVIDSASNVSYPFTYKIQNGFGSTNQGVVQIDTIKLGANQTYGYRIELLDESTEPARLVSAEVIEEKDEHLFLPVSNPASGAGALMLTNGNKDNNNLPFNESGTLTTGTTGKGTLTITLIHAPGNKNGATTAETGGETDAEAVFPVSIL